MDVKLNMQVFDWVVFERICYASPFISYCNVSETHLRVMLSDKSRDNCFH